MTKPQTTIFRTAVSGFWLALAWAWAATSPGRRRRLTADRLMMGNAACAAAMAAKSVVLPVACEREGGGGRGLRGAAA